MRWLRSPDDRKPCAEKLFQDEVCLQKEDNHRDKLYFQNSKHTMNFKSNDRIPHNHVSNEFEQLYIDLRCCEKRLYTDEEVTWLPDINEDHIHSKEWKIRKSSCEKLIRYLWNKNRS